MAPVDGRAQGLLARRSQGAGRRQQAQAVLEPDEDFVDLHHPHAGCGQLDRQGDAVETAADLSDLGRVITPSARMQAGASWLVRRTAGPHRSSTGFQPRRSGRGKGDGEGRHGPQLLPRNPQRLAAGRQYTKQPGRPAGWLPPGGRTPPAGARNCPAPGAGCARAGS